MVYYPQGMELEVISQVLRGSVNDVVVCRDRLSASGALYTMLVIRDRACARRLLAVLEGQRRSGEPVCLLQFTQNEEMLFLFPYREERKFSDFAGGQMTRPAVGEQICIHLVLECLSCALPWPLLYLVLEQDCVQIAKDNTVYFTMNLDLGELNPACTERNCVSSCARMVLELLAAPGAESRRSRRKRLKSFQLVSRKIRNNAYGGFPELYRDIRLTALPRERRSLRGRLQDAWADRRDGCFRALLVVCILLTIAAAVLLVSQLIYGEIPLLRLLRNTFDVIGTENLHTGGRP